MRKILSILFFVSVSLTPLQNVNAQTIRERIAQFKHQQAADVPSKPIEDAVDSNGTKRSFLVVLPERYSASNKHSLLIALHGGGGSMEYMAKESYGISEEANKQNAIVVYPNGTGVGVHDKFATWNAGKCCAKARDSNIDDVAYIKKVLEKVSSKYSVDRTRVFATGMSNGAMMSYRLACEMSESIKAIAAVAGTDVTINCHVTKPVSVLHIHAKDDTHVLYEGGYGEDAFKDPSKVTDFTSVHDTILKWVTLNGLNKAPAQTLINNSEVECHQYAYNTTGPKVQLCTTATGGHSWPGSTMMRPSKKPSNAINANKVMWDFFNSLH